MKKSIAILSALATSAVFAATEVQSFNTFGFVPVTASSTKLTCVAVPVKGYTEGASIKIAEILQVTDLAENDKLYTMSDGKYNEYTLQKDKTWKPSRIVTVGADGLFVEQAGTPATEATIQPGGAFWLQTEATKISIMGDATTPASAATITTGWQLIGNHSLTEPMKISTIPGVKGDTLIVGPATWQFTKNAAWKNMQTFKAATDTDVLAVGQGALLKGTAKANE